VGDVRFSRTRERLPAHNSGDDLPDGAMWHRDPDLDDDMRGRLAYRTDLYTTGHMTEPTTGYLDMLDRTVTGLSVTETACGA
jgi:condensation enzyme